MENIALIAQLVLGLGILNVWLLRRNKSTDYRGGDSRNMREEFAFYGLPFWFMCTIGSIKVLLATALIVGIWVPSLVQPAAIALAVLMVGAVGMHIKVRDNIKKTFPSIIMLTLCMIAVML